MGRGKPTLPAFDPVAFEQLSHEEKLKVLAEFIAALDDSLARTLKKNLRPKTKPQNSDEN